MEEEISNDHTHRRTDNNVTNVAINVLYKMTNNLKHNLRRLPLVNLANMLKHPRCKRDHLHN